MRKIKHFLLATSLFVTLIPFFSCALNSPNAFAAGSNVLFDGESHCDTLLGMTPWDCGVKITDDPEDLKTKTWIIATNIGGDITILASYLALGYIIYGGYLYTLSSGDPSKAATGKKTLTQAFIGLAISMSATAIMSTIRFVLVGQNGNLLNCATEGCIADASTLFVNTIHWVIGIFGVISAIFIVYGGISYSMSGGSAEKIKKAKTTIINAVIGLAIVALAELITAFVSNAIRQANSMSSSGENSYISHEEYHA